MTDKEVMQQALDALENHSGNYKLSSKECDVHNAAVEALVSAIAAVALPLTAPVTDDEIDAAFDALGLIRESTTVGEVRRVLEGFAAGRAAAETPCAEDLSRWKLGFARYEKARKLNPMQWSSLNKRNLDGEFFDDMIDALPPAYAAGVEPAALEPGWISVDERLPEIGRTPVLVAVEWRKYHENEDGSPAYSEGIDVTEGEYVPGFCDRAGYMESFQGTHGDSSAVTHWMPLPPPPATP